MPTFAELGLSPQILEAVDDVGYDSPSPIQEEAIPELLAGHDVIGQAQHLRPAELLDLDRSHRRRDASLPDRS